MDLRKKAEELSCKHKCGDCGLACSNIREAVIEMAQWKERKMIDKAVEWLQKRVFAGGDTTFYDDFKSYMEG